MDALGRLLARDEIRELAHRYAVAVDSRDLDALVALFAPDVRVGRDASGREALRRDFERQLGAIGVSILFVGNHVIDFDAADEARASGIVYCSAQIQDGERWIRQAIRYDDSYVRRDGAWLFARRKHLLWYGVVEARNPLLQPPAEWPASHTGRGTLPESLGTWREFWNRVRGDV
ncbi:MAG TPA: nuclear transport factor 2 family protein [Myxococcota bacterium]|nr:nuclear transport factor 2 family protein [Myxococcota bacterium]